MPNLHRGMPRSSLADVGVVAIAMLFVCRTATLFGADGAASMQVVNTAGRMAIIEGYAKRHQDAAQKARRELSDLVRVGFRLEPGLLLPGEEVAVRIEVRADRVPNRTLIVVRDCFSMTALLWLKIWGQSSRWVS